jgi:hypothetical protein
MDRGRFSPQPIRPQAIPQKRTLKDTISGETVQTIHKTIGPIRPLSSHDTHHSIVKERVCRQVLPRLAAAPGPACHRPLITYRTPAVKQYLHNSLHSALTRLPCLDRLDYIQVRVTR